MLVVVIGLLIGVSILGFFRLHQDRQNIDQAANSSGQERIALIAKSLSNLLAGYDYTNMEPLADSIVAAPDVQILRIINRNGKIVVERTNKIRGQEGQSLSFTAPVIFGTETIGSAKAVLLGDFDGGIMKDSVYEKFAPQGLRVVYTSPIPRFLCFRGEQRA